MEVSTEDGEKITVKDILIGDVWVLGGQSNMQIQVARTLDLFEDEVKGFPTLTLESSPFQKSMIFMDQLMN